MSRPSRATDDGHGPGSTIASVARMERSEIRATISRIRKFRTFMRKSSKPDLRTSPRMTKRPLLLAYPVPWATTHELNAVATPERYRSALQLAGFFIRSERSRRDFAVEHFSRQQASISASGGVPPLGLHTLMGARRKLQVRNMIDNISAGRIAPFEIVTQKM